MSIEMIEILGTGRVGRAPLLPAAFDLASESSREGHDLIAAPPEQKTNLVIPTKLHLPSGRGRAGRNLLFQVATCEACATVCPLPPPSSETKTNISPKVQYYKKYTAPLSSLL